MVALFFAAALSAAELYQQGALLFQSGSFAEAAARFEQARLIAPDDARLLKALGTSYAAMGDYERASEPLERSCRIDNSLEDACYYYARNFYALNRFEAAIAVLRKALGSDRRAWRIHLGIAQAFEGLGRAEKAEPEFRKSVVLFEAAAVAARGKPDFDPRLHYSIFLFRQGRLEDALPLARRVTRAWPEFGRGHYEIGRILQHQGKLAEAAEELEKAITGGAGPQAHLLLGRVYLRMGRTEEGERHLNTGSAAAR